MATQLAEFCIYTILHTDELAKAARGEKTIFHQSKAWVTGRELWAEAHEAGVGFPLILGDATDCSRLEYWGLLTRIEVEEDATHFVLEHVRPLPPGHTPQELVLRNSGEHIAPNFIRPYAICRTPGFLTEKLP